MIFWLGIWLLVLSACSRSEPPPATPPASTAHEVTPAGPTESPTPFQPSPTPEPLAARVGDIDIPLSDYQAELARYKAATGTDPSVEEQQLVLDDLIDRALLAQGASEMGFTVDEALVEDRYNRLAEQLGGSQGLSDWMASNGYVEASFRRDLALSIAAAWMRDQILAAVPAQTEQVHARQLLYPDAGQAAQAFAQLQSGGDFAKMAAELDPITQGDLGWFPRGYLPFPEIETAAFELEPEQFSDVLQTANGYHILQVIEHQEQRPLDPEAKLALQAQALQQWLEEKRGQTEIEVLLQAP